MGTLAVSAYLACGLTPQWHEQGILRRARIYPTTQSTVTESGLLCAHCRCRSPRDRGTGKSCGCLRFHADQGSGMVDGRVSGRDATGEPTFIHYRNRSKPTSDLTTVQSLPTSLPHCSTAPPPHRPYRLAALPPRCPLPRYRPTALPPYRPTALTALPPYCPTALLPYCPIALLPYRPTTLPPYRPIAPLPCCPTALLHYCPTAPPPHRPTALPP